MRRIKYSAAVSLDGYIARANGDYDWISFSNEPAAMEVMTDLWRNVDTVLTGRKTFEVALRMGVGDKGKAGVTNYVFSRTLPDGAVDASVLVREDAADFVRRLKAEPGKDIFLMGGGELANSLLDADLVDEVSFGVQPLLLGAGTPMFRPMSRQIDFELKGSRTFKNGGVHLVYDVRRTKPKTKRSKRSA